MPKTFPPPTEVARQAVSAMLAAAKIAPIGGGALRWSITLGGEHYSLDVSPFGRFIAAASYSDDDVCADAQERGHTD